MFSILVSFVLALAITGAMTPLVRKVALAVGAVDSPTARRVHTRRIPRLGGIGIVAGFFLPLLALFVLNTSTARIFFGAPRVVGGLIVGALMVATLGLLDDVVGVGAKRKLLVQSLAACAAFAAGLRIEGISLPIVGELHFGWLSLPLTVLWITAIVNALNLIDGLDGLAAGVAFFTCATNFVIAYLSGNVLICLLSATLAGAILGFLIHNFNPATIFMGDSGSMFLGFSLATTSMLGASSQKSPTVIAILVPLLAMGLPIMDMLFAMVRRFLERRPIFSPDRGHIHHRLLDLGLTQRRAVLILYGISLLFTLGALAFHLGRSWQIGVVLVVLSGTVVGIVRSLGYFNSLMMRSAARDRVDAVTEAIRRAVPAVLARIGGARGPEDLQAILEQFGDQAQLLALEVSGPESARLPSWRWERPELAGQQLREAVCARFTIKDAQSVACEVGFYWDSADGSVGPRADALLQLIADATESLAQRSARARVASRGHLRPVS